MGEEDLVTLVLPYIKSAREGVERLGQLLKTYGIIIYKIHYLETKKLYLL